MLIGNIEHPVVTGDHEALIGFQKTNEFLHLRIQFLQTVNPGIRGHPARMSGAIQSGPIQIGKRLVMGVKKLPHFFALLHQAAGPHKLSPPPGCGGEIGAGKPVLTQRNGGNALGQSLLKHCLRALPGPRFRHRLPGFQMVDHEPRLGLPNGVADDAVLTSGLPGGQGGKGAGSSRGKTRVGSQKSL